MNEEYVDKNPITRNYHLTFADGHVATPTLFMDAEFHDTIVKMWSEIATVSAGEVINAP